MSLDLPPLNLNPRRNWGAVLHTLWEIAITVTLILHVCVTHRC
jgi:hypothetical protein